MKRLALFFSMMFCLAMCGMAQEQTNEKPEVVFESQVYDYGTILKGSDGKCSFKFTNNSDSPLILTNVQASCGCTVPSWPKNAINPGDSSAIDVKYNTNNVGHFTKRITVTTNKKESTIILTIKGQVVEVLPEETPEVKE